MSAAEEGDSERSRWALSRMEGRPRGDGMEGREIDGRLAIVASGMRDDGRHTGGSGLLDRALGAHGIGFSRARSCDEMPTTRAG